ncbi:hypothetical protein ACFWQG_06870 [Rhodococcus sp. NPDC058532]|uniref:hypothetical protein n=1 Tax=Rhodococcus sp. NPDC058532 TaxID=3346540 RepID=UPI003666B907
MITWIVALLCSTAVGARIGRLTVRPPSLARVSIAIAAIALTAAATVRTATVSELLDGHREQLAATVFELCLIAFAATTALIAAASLTALSTRQQWPLAVASAAVAVLVAGTELTAAQHAPSTSAYLVAASLIATAVAARHVRWNVLGRAIGLYCAGLVVVAAVCVAGLVAQPREHLSPASGWWSLAVILVCGGCSSVMIEAWARAQLDLRRTRGLWTALTAAHPELLDSDYRSMTATLTAGDRISQILDGLYLHDGAGLLGPGGTPPPADPAEHAESVARWLHRTAVEVEPIDPGWLGTPDGLTDRQWILSVSAAYDRPRRRATATVA